MSSVVGVLRLTICAKVLRAECTTIPLPNDTPRMRIAEGKAMLEFTEIGCFGRRSTTVDGASEITDIPLGSFSAGLSRAGPAGDR